MSDNDRTAGVLGGMGPEATVDFMARVITLTEAACDQDHIRLLVDHNPKVPSRQAAMLEGVGDPGPVLADMARRLEAAGADFLVMPCNAAHAFAGDIVGATRIPLVSIIDVSVAAARELVPDGGAIGLLATTGCLEAGLFQELIAAAGLTSVVPDATELEALMDAVYAIKAGREKGEAAAALADVGNSLAGRGADVLIAGCTEIPLVLDDSMLPVPLVSSTDALARATVAIARGEVPLPAGRR